MTNSKQDRVVVRKVADPKAIQSAPQSVTPTSVRSTIGLMSHNAETQGILGFNGDGGVTHSG